ncbi:MAG: hypothetical protein ACI4QM_02640 [Alphaproteobacteria bacterium]
MAFISSIFKPFISFRFSILLGLIMALFLFTIQSETQPLSSFLTAYPLYAIAFLIIIGFRIIIWVLIEKAGMYSLKGTLSGIFSDYLTCILSLLCATGCLFLLHTFILS